MPSSCLKLIICTVPSPMTRCSSSNRLHDAVSSETDILLCVFRNKILVSNIPSQLLAHTDEYNIAQHTKTVNQKVFTEWELLVPECFLNWIKDLWWFYLCKEWNNYQICTTHILFLCGLYVSTLFSTTWWQTCVLYLSTRFLKLQIIKYLV